MPKVDGLALADWVTEHYPACRIVMTSGNACLLPSFAEHDPRITFLPKPVPLEKLIAAVKGECSS